MILLSLSPSCIDNTLVVFPIITAPYFKHSTGVLKERTMHLFVADDGNHPLDSPISLKQAPGIMHHAPCPEHEGK